MNLQKKYKALIVDDDPDVLSVLQMSFELDGIECVEARDGLLAIEKVYECLPDIIILDFMMPKLDGLSVATKLKEDPRSASIPIIIITGKGYIKELLEIREKGHVAAYLEKPFRVSSLIEKVRKIMTTKSSVSS